MPLIKYKTPQEARKVKKNIIKNDKSWGLKCNPKVVRKYQYKKGKKIPYYNVLARCK